MPTTYTDPTFSVSAIGNRTDAAGVDVLDVRPEELRFANAPYVAGYLRPGDAFKVRPKDTPGMAVVVGSADSARSDYYVVTGDLAGQGTYMVRLDVAGQEIAIAAADASQVRTDEIWLVVQDNPYDASGRALPRLAYRKGDVGGGAPGPDTTWRAQEPLASITVPAGATSITSGNITDTRNAAQLRVGGQWLTQLSRGHSRYYSDLEESLSPGVDQPVGFYLAEASDATVTRHSEAPGDSFTINESGIWAVTATFRFRSAAGHPGQRYGSITVNGVVKTADGGDSNGSAASTINLHMTTFLQPGDVVRAMAFQGTNTALAITGESPGWRNIDFCLLRRVD